METNKVDENAKRSIEAKVALRNHVCVYILVNSLLIIINLSLSPDYFWAKWPMLGWGVGLIFHGLKVFVFPSERLAFTEKMIEKETQKDMGKRYRSNT